jgi:protein-S-isoprenylcysteine O-methyltransferase Ste14
LTSPNKDNPGVLAPPPLIALVMIFAGFAAGLIKSLHFISGTPRYVIGAALLAVALIIGLTSSFKFRKAGTNVDVRKATTKIVTDGLYAYSRNPIYVALVILLFAMSVLLNNLWIMIFIPAFVIIMRRGVIEREELYLAEKFGAEYTDYKQRVRRWI